MTVFALLKITISLYRSARKGVESLVEASAAEAEAINKALKAAEAKAAAARDANGVTEIPGPDRDRGAEATPSGKPPASPSSALMGMNKLIHADGGPTPPPTGVRLHHRAVSMSKSHRCHRTVLSLKEHIISCLEIVCKSR